MKKFFAIFIFCFLLSLSCDGGGGANNTGTDNGNNNTNNGVPTAPYNLTVGSPTSNTLSLSWTGSGNVTGYYIYRSATSNGTYSIIHSSASSNYIDTGLTVSMAYYYKVSAYNSSGEGPQSSYAYGTTSNSTSGGVSANDLTLGTTAYVYGITSATTDNGSSFTDPYHIYMKYKNSDGSVKIEYDFVSDCSAMPLGGNGKYIFTNYSYNGTTVNGTLNFYIVYSGSATNFSYVFTGTITFSGNVNYSTTYNYVFTYNGGSLTYAGYWMINDQYYSYNSNGTVSTTPLTSAPSFSKPNQVTGGGCSITYSVTYDGNGNTGGNVPTDNANYGVSAVVTVLDNTGNLSKNGYTFAGWNTQSDGSGSIYTSGQTFSMGSANVILYAKWDGPSWTAFGSGTALGGGYGNYHNVYAIAFDSSGNLYAGGDFITASGTTVNYIAKWDGTSWSALGSGMNGYVHALAFDSSGNLYAGGNFTNAGGISAKGIAKWNGTTWSALGSGVNGCVYAIVIDSSGNLYAGGGFVTVGGTTMNGIAKWNGIAWSALGSGMNFIGGFGSPWVYALTFDSFGNLYAGGGFDTAGGVTVNKIAKWNGSSWSALDSGVGPGAGAGGNDVNALAFDSFGNLYAGGGFNTASGISAYYIAKWNGTSWSAGPWQAANWWVNGIVYALKIDSAGNLYAGGACYMGLSGSGSENYIYYLAKWWK